MQELFGREAGGIGLSFTRLTIGASDFSPSITASTTCRRGRPTRT
jgi:O-glycosyl hydrolase